MKSEQLHGSKRREDTGKAMGRREAKEAEGAGLRPWVGCRKVLSTSAPRVWLMALSDSLRGNTTRHSEAPPGENQRGGKPGAPPDRLEDHAERPHGLGASVSPAWSRKRQIPPSEIAASGGNLPLANVKGSRHLCWAPLDCPTLWGAVSSYSPHSH